MSQPTPSYHRTLLMYAVTIFLSAFLLFQVQPMIGKIILPSFGGSPAVWTTCMLFFQLALLGGYSYAHFLSSMVPLRLQSMVHMGMIVASMLALFVLYNIKQWKPDVEDTPITQILTLLALTIGLPYFVLSTTGPLMQEGFRRETGQPPYRLYALSNVGSLLALITYPFIFEPLLLLQEQTLFWSVGYVAFGLCCVMCTLSLSKPHAGVPASQSSPVPTAGARAGEPTWMDILFWLALACCGSATLLASTNQLCQEVTSIPFLWIVPLGLYLVTFIICFDHERWYHRGVFFLALFATMLVAVYTLWVGKSLSLWFQITNYSLIVFVCCMVAHGELSRSKPAPRYATLFYLMVSAGGALGGVLVALVAPNVFTSYLEFPIVLVAICALAMLAALRRGQPSTGFWPQGRFVGAIVLGELAIALAAWLIGYDAFKTDPMNPELDSGRNFYGVLHIVGEKEKLETANGEEVLVENCRAMNHGRITHGWQWQDEERRDIPTSYFSPDTGIGMSLQKHPRRIAGEPLKIGVVGLGCGSLAVYGKKNDVFHYYEINPQVVAFADKYFTYLDDSPADLDVILGDARIVLERQLKGGQVDVYVPGKLVDDNSNLARRPRDRKHMEVSNEVVHNGDLELYRYKDPGKSQEYDILAIDAFSSDAIPMHLLTKEAMEIFKAHLKDDGILLVHISNTYLDLSGVVRGVAEEVGLQPFLVIDSGSDIDHFQPSYWMLLTNNHEFLDRPEVNRRFWKWQPTDPEVVVWTDDYGSLWTSVDGVRERLIELRAFVAQNRKLMLAFCLLAIAIPIGAVWMAYNENQASSKSGVS